MNAVLATDGAAALRAVIGPEAATNEARAALEEERARLLSESDEPAEGERERVLRAIDSRLASRAIERERPALRRVLNGTGVVLHTNLGRAPMAESVAKHVAESAMGYVTLEYDLEEGARGHRDRALAAVLRALTGAEDALVVNNCAAAVLLAATALGAGKSIVVSRGELVEIGGGFRVPEVIESCGARLVEVGTTNKTRIEDYARALTADTAAIMEVHRSNFTIAGFTAKPTRASLAALAKERGVALVVDLGSGALIDLGIGDEPTVRDAINDGADLVLCSGDKLMGGPQCGIVVGSREIVGRLRVHPLMRALRPGRLVIAALDATLRLYASGRASREVPALAMFAQEESAVRARIERILAAVEVIAPFAATIERSEARVGGGSLPAVVMRSWALRIASEARGAIESVERSLRVRSSPPLIARIESAALWIDGFALSDAEAVEAGGALAQALATAHEDRASENRRTSNESA